MYRQGDPADSVFYIQSGKVKKTVVSEQGKEAVVAILGTGDFVGEGCLTGQPLRLATVSAMTECVIVQIAKADITRVIHEEPAFAELFVSHLLARNSRVEAQAGLHIHHGAVLVEHADLDGGSEKLGVGHGRLRPECRVARQSNQADTEFRGVRAEFRGGHNLWRAARSPWVHDRARRQRGSDPLRETPSNLRETPCQLDYFLGLSRHGCRISFCTRQLSNSATNSVFSEGHAISCTQPNCLSSLPDLPSLPRTLPSRVIL